MQFILPEYDINGECFTDPAFEARGIQPDGDGTRAFWLQKSADQLHARTLRIFVPMPGESFNEDGNQVTPENIYSFAEEAAAYDMRLAIVIHNSPEFDMTQEKEAWLRELIRTFKQKNALDKIAYINADNEINNHCGGSEEDCYHTEWDTAYGSKANAWVKHVVDIVKEEDAGILVTVGMATEVVQSDEGMKKAIDNYFEPHGSITLVEEIDFISPHNYGGGGYKIWQYVVSHNYPGPVVLEEYGYPTDPFETGNAYRETTPAAEADPHWDCRVNIWEGNGITTVCQNTAPAFVEVNIRALRQKQDAVAEYSGGFAFTLVDSKRKDNHDCENDIPHRDYFTGLFPSGDLYCEGTKHKSPLLLKNTGVRVCMYHTDNNGIICESSIVYLPLIKR